MKYAHIFKAAGGKFTLFITTGPAISEGVISRQVYDGKVAAKAAAKAAGAKAWNF